MVVKFEESFSFYNELWLFYTQNRGKIRSRYNDLTRKFLAYNDPSENPRAFLRLPQFEALEIYVFFKEFLDNRQVAQVFDEWRNREGVFSERSYYTRHKTQAMLMDDFTEKQTDALFKKMKKFQEDYPNYIYALTMGLGKTILMATCIFYEFLLANKYPKDKRFVHNALVFAPDKTVLESLREIVTFDKTKVVPPEYARVLDANIKFAFLDDPGVTLNVLDDSAFNIVISNTQKIVVKKKHTQDSAAAKLFNLSSNSLLSGLYGTDANDGEEDVVDDETLMENQRFQKLTRLRQLGVYVDEAHHLFGARLEKNLRSKTATKTSLRHTINLLASRTDVVACFNYTGTPYVNRQPLPEVVYGYGLAESIRNDFLKDAKPQGFENVKNEEFLRTAITQFWQKYQGQTFEDLNPKLAIFAATVEEATEEVRPVVENVLADLGVDSSKILVNVGDAKVTKDEDIRNFNNLDVPGSVGNEKQFIILVGKGREGWNCRSLFGVAMYRSPKSKIFVLQATMRCLRKITDEQQTALVFLSKENFDILDAELEKNFNMDLDGLTRKDPKPKRTYQVRVLPPERTITLKRIWREYQLIEKDYQKPLNFELTDDAALEEKYQALVYEKSRITSATKVKERNIDDLREMDTYSLYTLTAEVSRYLNRSPLLIHRILNESEDGAERIVEVVNRYNDVIHDKIIPTIFHAFYDLTSAVRSEDKELVLLRQPANAGYYEFRADENLVVEYNDDRLTDNQRAKSFHADTYCFDSNPEMEMFWQYVESEQVKEVYFTGMFTARQGDLGIQYYDPASKRIRLYYPDFVAQMEDDSWQLVEVKGDHQIDDELVLAKARAAEEMAVESGVEYVMYTGSRIMKANVLNKPSTEDCDDVLI
ncbi:TnsA endonuclease N-terminal domain-containing protein [Enteractinococcus coprophilus]|uniref:Type III restriction/modification enzyme restriction subunit n=1 Tax=Enteractinococcus coprophilus TaxID=1027633 RepID=A0A543ANT0_9MICC|nr:TnsA endonuclease N-terminal domain-containing protein [Enteractinococcus coprophilus]TQL74233.1 type III restriction/modification enzyme restriction subunit [Enteractinococcus coprophilus]